MLKPSIVEITTWASMTAPLYIRTSCTWTDTIFQDCCICVWAGNYACWCGSWDQRSDMSHFVSNEFLNPALLGRSDLWIKLHSQHCPTTVHCAGYLFLIFTRPDIKSHYQTKNKTHWSGSKTSAHTKLWVDQRSAGTVSSYSGGPGLC